MHPQVMRVELAFVIARLLSTILKQSWLEVPEDRMKANITPIIKKQQEQGPRELQAHRAEWAGRAESEVD